MKTLKTILFLLVPLCAAGLAFSQIAAPKYDASNRSQVPTQGSSSTVTPITSATTQQVALSSDTVEVVIVPATSGTTFYRLGSFSLSATNAVSLTAGQTLTTNIIVPGSTISVSGSGAFVIEETR